MIISDSRFAVASRHALAWGIALAALAAPVAAQAQAQAQAEAAPPPEEAQPAPPADDADASGNEIVVTATKREQTLQDVPVAVTVTTAVTIERAQIRDIRDLSTVVPSLRVNTLQSSASTNFYIRGFGNGANNAGIEPSVGLFVDGVYRSRSASMISDLPDVQRIEVLRGPQSTLFGKNASAGVISLVTKEPKFTLGGNFEASYGNYNAVVAKGYVTGPISQTVAASLAAGYNKRDGYVTDTGTGTKSNERNRWFVRGQVLIKPSADLKVRLIGDYSKIDEVCCAAINLQRSPGMGASQVVQLLGGQLSDPAAPYADRVAYNFPSTNKIDNWGLSGQVDYSAGILKFSSITAFRHTGAITNQDSDFSAADLLRRNYQDLQIDTFTQELRASTDWDGPFNALLGAFYFNEKIKQHNELQYGSQFQAYANGLIQGATGCFNTPVSLACNNLAGLSGALGAVDGSGSTLFRAGQGMDENYALKDESWSAFAQFDYRVNDRLTLTGGINYTHDAKRFSTATTSSDVFSAIDLDAPALAPLRAQLLAAGALDKGATLQQAQLFAAAYMNDPTANPLNDLKAFQFMPQFLNVPNALETGRIGDGNWSFTARAAYDLTDRVNVYASYATGYKAASVNLSRDSRPVASVQAAFAGNPLYPNLTVGSRFADPEDSAVWEAGLKGNWGNATANLAVFKQSIKGFQSNIFTGTGFKLANAGKQSAWGVEFEGMIKPTRELTFNVGMTYLDPKYDDFRQSGVGDITGTRPGGISSFTATIGGQWDHELGNGDHVILRGDYHYEAPFALVEGLPNLVVKVKNAVGQVTGLDYTAAIAAATSRKQEIKLANASLTYAMHSGLELTLWGRNITNNRTILQIFDSPVQPGSISAYPSEPRTWGGSVRYRF